MRYLNYIAALMFAVVLFTVNNFIELYDYRYRGILLFSVASIIVLSMIVAISYRNFMVSKTFDYIYFCVSYLVIAVIWAFVVVTDFTYVSFSEYLFQFIKLAEALVFFFGIFILRDRVKTKNIVQGILIITIITFFYFFVLLEFNFFFLNLVLLYLGLIYIYSKIENTAIKNMFLEILELKLISEIYKGIIELTEIKYLYVGIYFFFLYSFVKMLIYFNKSLTTYEYGEYTSKERKFLKLIATMDDGIVILSDYFVKKINKKALTMFGFSSVKGIKGKNIFSLFDELKKEDIDSTVAKYPKESVIVFKRYNEKERRIKVIGYEYEGEGHSRDLVLILKNQDYSREFFYNMNDEAGDIVYIYDVETRKYKYISPAVEEILGYSRNEFYNEPNFGSKIIHEKDYSKHIELFRVLREFRENRIMKYKASDGHIVTLLENMVKVNLDGKTYYYGVAKDITKYEKKLWEVVDQNEELQEMLSKKDIGMVVVSHEIRTPITAMIGFLENILINKNDIPERTHHMISKVYSNSIRLKELVNNVLDLNKINMEKFELAKGNIEIGEVVREILMNNEILMELKNIKGQSLIEKEMYAFVDESTFFQIITNLISNAIKYNRPNGEINVNARYNDDKIIIEVQDTGTGISVEDKEKVFREYERGKGVKEKGTGIGLPLTKKMVEMNEGQIWYESEHGKGTTFFVEFKRNDTEEV